MASIQKQGTIYYVVMDLPRNSNGARQQKWYKAGPKRRDAERMRNELAHQLDQGTFVEPSKTSLAEYLGKWLETSVRPTTTAKTHQVYSDIVHKNLVPAIGHIRLDKLQPLDIQNYYNKQLATGGRKGTGLSGQSVLHHHRVLKKALRQAVRWRMLTHNPADDVDAPRAEHRVVQTLDRDGVQKLLSVVEGTELYIPTLIAVNTGMRRGEILALKWSEVDLERKTIVVKRSLEQVGGTLSFKDPKSKRGRRTIAISNELARALRIHFKEQARRRLQMGPAWEINNLVVPGPLGAPWKIDSFSSRFSGCMKRAGIGITFHGLRHTHATLLLLEEVNPKVVSERLGHATVSITLDTYSHVLPAMQEKAAEAIERALSYDESSLVNNSTVLRSV